MPSRSVTSGFYRVHLWVLMGFNTLAALCLFTKRESLAEFIRRPGWVLALAVGLAVASYVGAVFWLYERKGAGVAALLLIMLGGLVASALVTLVIKGDVG